MKIYAISDLHLGTNADKPMDIFGPKWENYWQEIVANWLSLVKPEDIVLIAGDISWAMRLEDAAADLQLIANLPGTKILVRGNHDYWWSSISKVRSLAGKNIICLQNDAVKIGNYVFCGTRGWSVPEKNHKTADDEKIYNREVLRMEMALQNAQKLAQEGDQIIALVHYPPFNSRAEDSDFTKLFEKYNVTTVVFGHLHAYDYGIKLESEKNGITYYLTSCDLVGNRLVNIK